MEAKEKGKDRDLPIILYGFIIVIIAVLGILALNLGAGRITGSIASLSQSPEIMLAMVFFAMVLIGGFYLFKNKEV